MPPFDAMAGFRNCWLLENWSSDMFVMITLDVSRCVY
jgi:hypothetical protein